jgi:hypothetical protein
MAACSVLPPPTPVPTPRPVHENVDCGAIDQESCVAVVEAAREGLLVLSERRRVASISVEAVPRRGECGTDPDCEHHFAIVTVTFTGGGRSAILNVFRTDMTQRMSVRFN